MVAACVCLASKTTAVFFTFHANEQWPCVWHVTVLIITLHFFPHLATMHISSKLYCKAYVTSNSLFLLDYTDFNSAFVSLFTILSQFIFILCLFLLIEISMFCICFDVKHFGSISELNVLNKAELRWILTTPGASVKLIHLGPLFISEWYTNAGLQCRII